MAEMWICRGKHELAEFIEAKSFIKTSIVLPYDIFNIFASSAQMVLIHEILKFRACDSIYTISINQLEELHWAEVRVFSKVLPP